MIKYDDNVENRYGIKLLDGKTIKKQAVLGTQETYEIMQSVCFYFMEHPDPMVVPIYSFELIEGPPPGVTATYANHVYTYTMKRLAMLSEEEKSLISFHSTIYYHGENYLLTTQQDEYKEVSAKYPELHKFMDEVRGLGRYTDIHDGNFLKDEDESYKIIDLEGFIRTPWGRSENDWLRGK